MSDEPTRTDAPGTPPDERELSVPAELPVLPLRDTVLFPSAFMPLAVARERSVRLVEAAVEGEQLVGVFTQREAAVEEPGRDDLYSIGTITHIHKMFKLPDGSLRLIVQGLARVTLDGITASEPFLRAAVRAAEEVVSEDDRLEVDAPAAEHQEQLPAGGVPFAPALRRAAGAVREHLGTGQAGRLHRVQPDDAGHCRQAAGSGDARRSRPHGSSEPHPGQGDRGAGARFEDPVGGAVGDGQEPARVSSARAAQGDSEGVGRERRPGQGDRGTAAEDPGGRHAGDIAEGGPARARPALAHAGRGGRVHRVAHLYRLADRPALESADRGEDRSRADAEDPRRRPLRTRQGEGPHPRVPGRQEAESRREGTDPLLRRPARGRGRRRWPRASPRP